jgi:hypothetical protein
MSWSPPMFSSSSSSSSALVSGLRAPLSQPLSIVSALAVFNPNDDYSISTETKIPHVCSPRFFTPWSRFMRLLYCLPLKSDTPMLIACVGRIGMCFQKIKSRRVVDLRASSSEMSDCYPPSHYPCPSLHIYTRRARAHSPNHSVYTPAASVLYLQYHPDDKS